MAAVPATLLSISLYAAVIFCGIMIFKKCTQNKLSPVLQFALWFLLIVRLALPFTAETGFHFVTLPQQGTVEMDAASAKTGGEPLAALPSGTVGSGKAAQVAEEGEGTAQNQAVPKPAQQGRRQGQEAPPAVSSGSLPPAAILTMAWLAGAGAVALCMAGCCLRMRRGIRRSTVLPDERISRIFEACKKELDVRGGIRLRLCSALTTPALTVSLRPVLLLPLDLLAEGEETLRYAALHELTHYKRGDHVVRLAMNVLKAVWWFHPVVWLADRQIVMDMETACDSMVVRRMEKEEKKRYAATVLAMFSEDREARYVLGMALGSSKQVAEQRIRGMYMNRKTKRGVRLAALVLTGMLGIACFTTACAPVRAAETGQAALAPSLQPVSAGGTGAAEAEHITKTLDTGNENIKIVIDADVERPDAETIPMREALPQKFTQEDAERVAEILFEEETPAAESGTIEEGTLLFQGGGGARMTAGTSETGEWLSYKKGIPEDTAIFMATPATQEADKAQDMEISRAEAEALAVQAAKAIDPDMELAYTVTAPAKSASTGLADEDWNFYACDFARHIDGVPVTYNQQGDHIYTTGETDSAGNPRQELYPYESLRIAVNDSGIFYVAWGSPYIAGKILETPETLISAEEALDILAERYVSAKGWPGEELKELRGTIDIDRITLGYGRIMNEDQTFSYVPVWDFFGNGSFGQEGEEVKRDVVYAYSLFTVNAVDGSVISRPGAETAANTAGSETNVRITAAAETVQGETGERVKFTFRIQNNMDATLENGILKAPPLSGGGQLGKTFDLEPGETRIMTWETPLTENMTVHAAVYFMADGRETYAEAPPIGADFPVEGA